MSEINVVALVKGVEKYILLYDDEHRRDACRQLGHWACNYDLSFTWWDAAQMSKSIRQNTPSTTDGAGTTSPPVRRKPRKNRTFRKWRRRGF